MVWSHHLKDDALLDVVSGMIAENERSGSIVLPNLRESDTLVGASDISGDHKTSRFVVFSFLLAEKASCHVWTQRRRMIRANLLPTGRRLGYKELNDCFVRNSLASILDAANTINGILVAFVVEKSIPSIFSSGPPIDLRAFEFAKLTDRYPKNSERLLRQFCLTGLFIGSLSRQSQDVYWFFDEDEIFANADLKTSAMNVAADLWGSLIPHKMGRVRLLTTQADNGDRAIEDVTALPDLAGGALADGLMALQTSEMDEVRRVLTPLPRASKTKTNYILSWLSNNAAPLKKMVIMILPGSDASRLRTVLLFLHRTDDAIWEPGSEWRGSIFGGVP